MGGTGKAFEAESAAGGGADPLKKWRRARAARSV
jgi:hypothetical protein